MSQSDHVSVAYTRRDVSNVLTESQSRIVSTGEQFLFNNIPYDVFDVFDSWLLGRLLVPFTLFGRPFITDTYFG